LRIGPISCHSHLHDCEKPCEQIRFIIVRGINIFGLNFELSFDISFELQTDGQRATLNAASFCVRVSISSGNPGNLLEFEIPSGNTGNLVNLTDPPGNVRIRSTIDNN